MVALAYSSPWPAALQAHDPRLPPPLAPLTVVVVFLDRFSKAFLEAKPPVPRAHAQLHLLGSRQESRHRLQHFRRRWVHYLLIIGSLLVLRLLRGISSRRTASARRLAWRFFPVVLPEPHRSHPPRRGHRFVVRFLPLSSI